MKNLDKVRLGDFARRKGMFTGYQYAFVLQKSNGEKCVAGDGTWGLLDDSWEYRRMDDPSNADYNSESLERSWKIAEPIFPQHKELTRAEIADKFDIPVDQLRIEDK